jgi:hypothetical protein
MPKITEEPLEAKQVILFKKDLDALRQIYGPSLGVNKAIRTIVRMFVKQTTANAGAVIDLTESAEEKPASVEKSSSLL